MTIGLFEQNSCIFISWSLLLKNPHNSTALLLSERDHSNTDFFQKQPMQNMTVGCFWQKTCVLTCWSPYLIKLQANHPKVHSRKHNCWLLLAKKLYIHTLESPFKKTATLRLYHYWKETTQTQNFSRSSQHRTWLLAASGKRTCILACWSPYLIYVKHKYFFRCLTSRHIKHGTCIQFSTKYSLSQTNNLCYEIFERNNIIDTTAAHFCTFFQKSQVIKLEIFFDWP